VGGLLAMCCCHFCCCASAASSGLSFNRACLAVGLLVLPLLLLLLLLVLSRALLTLLSGSASCSAPAMPVTAFGSLSAALSASAKMLCCSREAPGVGALLAMCCCHCCCCISAASSGFSFSNACLAFRDGLELVLPGLLLGLLLLLLSRLAVPVPAVVACGSPYVTLLCGASAPCPALPAPAAASSSANMLCWWPKEAPGVGGLLAMCCCHFCCCASAASSGLSFSRACFAVGAAAGKLLLLLSARPLAGPGWILLLSLMTAEGAGMECCWQGLCLVLSSANMLCCSREAPGVGGRLVRCCCHFCCAASAARSGLRLASTPRATGPAAGPDAITSPAAAAADGGSVGPGVLDDACASALCAAAAPLLAAAAAV
jgi:hypothetical protein